MPFDTEILAVARAVGSALNVRVSWVVVVVFAVPLAMIDCRVTLVGGVSLTMIVKSWVKSVVAVAPFTTVALTFTVPAAVGVNVFSLIVAVPVPLGCTLHEIVLFVALAGLTMPVRVRGVPTVAVVG